MSFLESIAERAHVPVVVAGALLVVLVLFAMALAVRARLARADGGLLPDEGLSVRNVAELLVEMLAGLAEQNMGPNWRRYFPIIGASALFILFSNLIGLVPGFSSPTSSWSVTLGMALVVLLTFNYYGLKENGVHYLAHFAGPKWYLAPIILPIELFSTIIVRPFTLSIRLMVNIAVDHLLGALFLGLVTLFVPLPIMMLGIIVCVVQTVVFCLLTCVYIGLATEKHEAHH